MTKARARSSLAGVLAALAAACASAKAVQPAPQPPRPAPALEGLGARPPAPPAAEPNAATAPVTTAPAGTTPDSSTPAQDAGQAPTVPAEAPATLPAPAPSEPAPLGWVAGTPVTAEDLLVEWSDVSSKEVWLLLDRLVATRLALAESSRLGIRLEPEEVEQETGETRTKLAQEVAKKWPDLTLEQYITRELGFDPERYLDRVRRATIRQMLAERAVRANSLQSATVAVRLIVVPDQTEMEKIQAALQGGADFATLAREHSVDDTASAGGLVPFVVEQEHSPLARLAFQTPPGELGGPLPTADHVFLIRVEEKRTPLEGDWGEIRAAVEASLAEHPVQDSEFLHWKLAMEERYPIDMRRLIDLLGAKK